MYLIGTLLDMARVLDHCSSLFHSCGVRPARGARSTNLLFRTLNRNARCDLITRLVGLQFHFHPFAFRREEDAEEHFIAIDQAACLPLTIDEVPFFRTQELGFLQL